MTVRGFPHQAKEYGAHSRQTGIAPQHGDGLVPHLVPGLGDADMWLNPGHCRSVSELVSTHHFFDRFGPVVKGLPVYNNTLRTTEEGGNDFWETGTAKTVMKRAGAINIRHCMPINWALTRPIGKTRSHTLRERPLRWIGI